MAGWVPEPVIRSPAVAAHFLMDAFQAVFSAVFARTALAVADGAGPAVPAGARDGGRGLGVSAVLGMPARVVAIVDGATPPWLYLVQNTVLAVVFTLFAVAVALPGSAALWARTRRPAPA